MTETEKITYQLGSGYYRCDYSVGDVLRMPGHRGVERNPIVVIEEIKSRYYREDGLCFGVGDDEGYVYTYTCRLADSTEAAPVLEKERLRAEKAELLYQLENVFCDHGYIPAEQVKVEGVRIAHPRGGFDIYGGGIEFCVEQNGLFVWRLVNNGRDGDNWARNNVATGGAGAIGTRYELTTEIRDILQKLTDQPLPFRGENNVEQLDDEIMKKFIDDKIQAAIEKHEISAVWLNWQCCEKAPMDVLFVRLGSGIKIGRSLDQKRTYLGIETSMLSQFAFDGLSDSYSRLQNWQDRNNSNRNFIFEIVGEGIEKRLNEVNSKLPSWVHENKLCRIIFTGQTTGFGPIACANTSDAIRYACTRQFAINPVADLNGLGTFCDEAQLVSINRESKYPFRLYGENGFMIWAKGEEISASNCGFFNMAMVDNSEKHENFDTLSSAAYPRVFTSTYENTLTEDALKLVKIAARQESWRTCKKWLELLGVSKIESSEVITTDLQSGMSWSSSTEIKKIVVSFENPNLDNKTYYLVENDWGYMAEDADAGTEVEIFEDLADAEQRFSVFIERCKK